MDIYYSEKLMFGKCSLAHFRYKEITAKRKEGVIFLRGWLEGLHKREDILSETSHMYVRNIFELCVLFFGAYLLFISIS